MRKYNLWTYFYCVFVAFVFLLICSRSSFLYPCNDWNDANCFFTMGKGMMNGQVLYKDLFEQKGPYLFLIYGIAWLISHDTFFGVFILEIVALSVFLYYAYRLIRLYSSENVTRVLLPILACAMTVSWSFYWGGSAEEFCLPFMAIGLYHIVNYYKNNCEVLDRKIIFANGLFAGIILQIKYNILGFWFAWIVLYTFLLFIKRQWFEAAKAGMIFVFGMMIPSIPWLIYFGIHGALGDYFECYIYNNIFLYANMSDGPELGEKVYLWAKILYNLIVDNTSYFVFVVAGMLFYVLSWKTKWNEKINICLLFGCTFLGIYIGDANLPYYSIPLMVFAIPGAAFLGKVLDWCIGKLGVCLSDMWKRIVLYSITIMCSAGIAFAFSGNTHFIGHDKDDFFLFRFKEIVDEEENATLLNYGCLDVGLYTIADIMPTCRFYHACNMAYEEMDSEQIRYIEEGLIRFVVAGDNYPECIYENYELVASEVYLHFGTPVNYHLFRIKTD